jgi:hypothetical protein
MWWFGLRFWVVIDRLGVRAPDLRDSSIERLQRPNKTSV